jgi:hypothetical protein
MTKSTILSIATALVLATSFGSAAIAAPKHQPQVTQTQTHSNFEKVWFKLAQGEQQ